MAKNRKPGNERNPFKVVLYILIVLLLIACIGFLFYENRQRQAAYREEIKEMASGETEYIRAERLTETETEEQTEKQTQKKQTEKKQTEKKQTEKNTENSEKAETETESETEKSDALQSTEPVSETEFSSETKETETETETEAMSETESESSSKSLRSIKIVVLNASGREGAAAMWKDVLEKGGYKEISVGSYSHKEEGTTIYTKNAELGEDLRSIFPNSNVYADGIEDVKGEIESPDTVKNADSADAYIVVGKNNTEI